MLEGLEVSVLRLKEVLNISPEFRIESEFYQHQYFQLKEILAQKQTEPLKSLLTEAVKTGHTPSMKVERFYGGEIKFIKTDNLRENYIKEDFSHTLTPEGNEEIQNTYLKENDIITTIIGATHEIIARSCLITKEILPANINQNIALIRVNRKKIAPEVLNIYINSKYGRLYLYYLSRQTEQVNLNCSEVEQLVVPVFSKEFQRQIVLLAQTSNQNYRRGIDLYIETELRVLAELNLRNWRPTEEAKAVKTFTESFGASGRLDAEYYQPKYDEIEKKIKSYRGGWGTISECLNLLDENFSPTETATYNYIELADIGNSGEITGCITDAGKELPSRARRVVHEGDVIISSIEGSLEKCALISKEYHKALCSTGFYVVNSAKINSETLLVLFKSYPMQQIMKKNCSGTILTAMNKDEFLSIPVPLIDSRVQREISEQIQKSFALREESAKLLEVAKKAVEIAIEKSEEGAMRFIEEYK